MVAVKCDLAPSEGLAGENRLAESPGFDTERVENINVRDDRRWIGQSEERIGPKREGYVQLLAELQCYMDEVPVERDYPAATAGLVCEILNDPPESDRVRIRYADRIGGYGIGSKKRRDRIGKIVLVNGELMGARRDDRDDG